MRPARTGLRTAFLVVGLFTVLAGDAWRYTLTWWGWGVIALSIAVISVVVLIRTRHDWGRWGLPIPLLVFLALTVASITWSFYPAATAAGVVATLATTALGVCLAVTFSWRELVRGLGITLRILLVGSLVFELIIAVFVRRPVFPLWVDYGDLDPVPKLLYWSRNELFEVFAGGRIQGLVGNASTLGFLALLALIVFAVQLLTGTVRRRAALAWLAVAVAVVLMTRSATITVGILAVALAAGAAVWMGRTTGRRRVWLGAGLLAALIAAVVATVVLRAPLLAMLGRGGDLTNRVEIWQRVVELAQQRPAAGWGWVGYWPPWVPPFDDLLEVNGVQVMHAHNAWLDVWLQLGVLGLLVFGALVLSTATRAWLRAIDPLPRSGRPRPTAVELLPWLLLVALLVQSVAESRLLIEYGWVLLVLIAVKTRSERVELT